MVYIIKKTNDETLSNTLYRVAALMLNIEYGINIYNVENSNLVSDGNQEKFNVQEYKYFTDTYDFECGTVIIVDSLQNYPNSNYIKDKLLRYTSKLDIYKDANVYKPYNTISGLETTYYTAIWGQIPRNKKRRSIHYNRTNNKYQKILQDQKHAFIWNISPVDSITKSNDYMSVFRSLSTIIVDIHNIIKYDENMNLIDSSNILTKNYNFPIKKQLQIGDKTIFSNTIWISRTAGPAFDMWNNEYCKYCNFIEFDKHNIEVYSIEYEDLTLTPGIKNKSLKNLLHNNLSGQKCDKTPVDKLKTETSAYDVCTDCHSILFGDFYIINTKYDVQFAVCKICAHYTDIITYNIVDLNFSVMKSNIPRDIYQAIDLIDKPKNMTTDEFHTYKSLLKILHKNFPKEININNRQIDINDEIVLYQNLNIFSGSFLDYILKTNYKMIVPIQLIH